MQYCIMYRYKDSSNGQYYTGFKPHSPRKQQTFCHTTTGFPKKWCLRNQHRNSIPMICHYLDLGMHRKFASTNPEHYPNLGSDPSSASNFCTRSSLVILWGNQQWQHYKMSAVFSLRLHVDTSGNSYKN